MSLYDLYWFLGIFIVIYVFYLFFSVLKKKKFNKNKVPVELRLLINKYRLDMSKINYRIGIVSSFDIAFVATFVFKYIKNEILMFLIGSVMLIPLIVITFSFIGKYYVKKGCVIDGNKEN